MTINGVELAYAEHGAGDPFVLVHGWSGAGRDWDGVVEHLAKTRRVITLDHRGHGNSTNTGDAASYTFEQLVSDFSAFVDQLGLETFDLLGHSMGGVVAMRYTLRNQARVRSLILMDTGAAASPGMSDYLRAGLDLVRERGTLAFYEVVKGFLGEGEAGDKARSEYKWKLEHMDPVAFTTLGHELTVHESVLDQLAGLTVPTTVLVGENDVGLRVASDDLAATIPGAVLEVIPDAAHSPQVENRDAWVAVVERHLARVAV